MPGDRVCCARLVFPICRKPFKLRWQVIALASLVYFVSLFARVFAWYILLQKRVSFKDAFFAMNAGYLLNNVFPFRLGEIGRALLLDRPEGPKAFEVLSSVVMERVFDVFWGPFSS